MGGSCEILAYISILSLYPEGHVDFLIVELWVFLLITYNHVPYNSVLTKSGVQMQG